MLIHLVACSRTALFYVPCHWYRSAVYLGMAEELNVAPTNGMSSNKTGATFIQLVDGNRVHFRVGQSAQSSEHATPRTGVPLIQ